MRIAVYPGSFDPITNGHIDLIKRGARIFDKLYVAIAINAGKDPLFSKQERMEMVTDAIKDIAGVEAVSYDGLVINFCKKIGAGVILRGIRDTVDLHAELEIATANLIIGDIETVFLMTSGQHVLTSSTLIKQIVEIGQYDVDHLTRLVPLDVARRLEQRLRSQHKGRY